MRDYDSWVKAPEVKDKNVLIESRAWLVDKSPFKRSALPSSQLGFIGQRRREHVKFFLPLKQMAFDQHGKA